MKKLRELALNAGCAASAMGLLALARIAMEGQNATMTPGEILMDWVSITLVMCLAEDARQRAKARYFDKLEEISRKRDLTQDDIRSHQ